MKDILKKLENSQELDIKVGGVQELSNSMEREVSNLLEISNALSKVIDNVFFDFGDNNLVLYTTDFKDVGALAVYLARQARCKVLCCREETTVAELSNIIGIHQILEGAEYLIRIEPNKCGDSIFYIDRDSYSQNNYLVNKFKIVMSRPFGGSVSIIDNSTPQTEIEKLFKCGHIHIEIKDDALVYIHGPVLRTSTIAHFMYMWLRDESDCNKKRLVMLSRIGEAAMLEALAEEASELAQAASKKARKLRGENPLPKTLEELDNSLIEEYTDVYNCAFELGLKPDEDIIIYKDNRFLNRWYAKEKNKS